MSTIPANVLAFVSAKTTPKTLDSLHGNIGWDSYDIAVQNHEDAHIDYEVVKRIQLLKAHVGTKIFAMDKGSSAMLSFFEDNENLITQPVPGWEMIDFGDFNVYREKNSWRYYDFYMDCQRVVLPAKTEEKLEKTPRGWVVSSKDNLYFLPEMCYPKSLKPFLKWLKTTKRVSIKVEEIWNKTIHVREVDKYSNDYIHIFNFTWNFNCGSPMKLIKSRKDLDNYNNVYIKTELPAEIDEVIELMKSKEAECSRWDYKHDIDSLLVCKKELKPIVVEDFPVTQQMIDEYLSYRNDCYKIIGQ